MRASSMLLAVILSGAISVAWSLEEPPVPAPVPASTSASPSTPASAAQPTSAATPTAPTPGATPATTPPAATNPAAIAKPSSGQDAGTDFQIRELRSRGFKAENRNGTTVWCRKEAPIGSRFESKKCATAAQLDMAADRSKEFTDNVKNYGLPFPKAKP